MLNDIIIINSIVRGDLNLRQLHWKHNVVLVGNTTRLMEKQITKSLKKKKCKGKDPLLYNFTILILYHRDLIISYEMIFFIP